MIDSKLVEQKMQEQVLKDKMIADAVLILSTVEWLQKRVEEKLLEINETDEDNIEKLLLIKKQVLSLLARLRAEERQMDRYMLKYRRILDEKKALLFGTCEKKQIHLRGIQKNERGAKKSS
jgi:hypothetical protein